VKKSNTILLWIIAIIIGIIPGILALIQGGSKNTVGRYYLFTVIIVTILWLVIKRITKDKKAI
jgi:hypothetical protein